MSANIGKVVRSRKSEVRSQKKEVFKSKIKEWFRFYQLLTSNFGLPTSDFSLCSFEKLPGDDPVRGTDSDYIKAIA